jgi:hypothetical protein
MTLYQEIPLCIMALFILPFIKQKYSLNIEYWLKITSSKPYLADNMYWF